jgi:sugar/nucleoside kinase (ribokinase family)
MSLLIVGSVAFDSIKTPFGSVNKTLGGSASYFSLAARFFTKPTVVGVVGDDFNRLDVFKKRGIDISGIQKAKGKTFHWAGEYSFDLNSRETLKTELGVFADFKPVLSAAQKQSQYVFLGNIHPKLQLDVLGQITKPKFVGLDTMNYWIESAPADLKKVLAKVNILIINDSEAREFSKEHNLIKASKKILGIMNSSLHPSPSTLIIKRGEYGLLMFQKNKIFNLPGYPLEDVADPTGAGDTFAGGFMGYLAKTNDTSWPNLKKACVSGSVMASFCVEKLGTKKLQEIGQLEIRRRLKDFERLTQLK